MLRNSFFEEVYEGNTQIIAKDYQGGTTQFTAECSTEGGLEEHNSDNVHLESLRNHLKNDVLVCHININSIENKLEELENVIKRSMHT